MKDNISKSDLNKLVSLRKPSKINSHKKGGDFSRKICNIFNKKFETKEFSKTPGSGAYATTHNLPEHLKIYGDIITPKKFRFCIECKKGYNDITFYDFLNPKSLFWKFIEQCEKDSLTCKKDPLIIIKQDYKPIFVIVDYSILIPYEIKFKNPNILVYKDQTTYIILPLEKFLNYNINWHYSIKGLNQV